MRTRRLGEKTVKEKSIRDAYQVSECIVCRYPARSTRSGGLMKSIITVTDRRSAPQITTGVHGFAEDIGGEFDTLPRYTAFASLTRAEEADGPKGQVAKYSIFMLWRRVFPRDIWEKEYSDSNMASLVSPTRHIARAFAPTTRLTQRRWAQVHDIRFLATHQKPDQRVFDKYKAKLEQKAKQ